jgi:hypothetical protein
MTQCSRLRPQGWSRGPTSHSRIKKSSGRSCTGSARQKIIADSYLLVAVAGQKQLRHMGEGPGTRLEGLIEPGHYWGHAVSLPTMRLTMAGIASCCQAMRTAPSLDRTSSTSEFSSPLRWEIFKGELLVRRGRILRCGTALSYSSPWSTWASPNHGDPEQTDWQCVPDSINCPGGS